MTIAFIGHTGPYGELPFEMYTERLYGWAKEKRILPGFYPMAICYDNPDETPPEECRTDIATAFAVPSGGVYLSGLIMDTTQSPDWWVFAVPFVLISLGVMASGRPHPDLSSWNSRRDEPKDGS